MILQQFYLGCLAHASYLIGDEQSKHALVVDPQRDIDRYLAEAEARGLTITHVLLTHFHADFLAGHLELRNRVGARIVLGARATAEFDFLALGDRDSFELGPEVRLIGLETPGHTPEGLSLLVYDLKRNPEQPHAVLTGDTLFIGDVGRPDLLASIGVSKDELGRMLYHSLHDKLLSLPDETLVYPAHGAGSMCGKNLSTDTVSDIGTQRRYNYALQPMTEDEFIAIVTADQPPAPVYFGYDAALNRMERGTLDAALDRSLKPLSLEDVLRRQNEGTQVVDAREPSEFAPAHLAGALSIGLGGKYATWAGSLLSRDQPVIIVAEPGREREAAMRLGRIGYDHVAGYLDGGMAALARRPEVVVASPRLSPENLREQIDADPPPFVVDVRQPGEYATGYVGGATHIPLGELPERLDEVPADRHVVFYCRTGYRSMVAHSVAQRAGRASVSDLVGGIEAWKASGLPVVAPAPAG